MRSNKCLTLKDAGQIAQTINTFYGPEIYVRSIRNSGVSRPTPAAEPYLTYVIHVSRDIDDNDDTVWVVASLDDMMRYAPEWLYPRER